MVRLKSVFKLTEQYVLRSLPKFQFIFKAGFNVLRIQFRCLNPTFVRLYDLVLCTVAAFSLAFLRGFFLKFFVAVSYAKC